MDNNITHAYITNTTNNQKIYKTKNTNYNRTLLCTKIYKGDHSHQLALQYPNFLLKIDHQQNHNSKYPKLCRKRKKEKKDKKKREKSWKDHTRLGGSCTYYYPSLRR